MDGATISSKIMMKLVQWSFSYKAMPSVMKEVASHEGDNLLVFHYLNASKIWLDKSGSLW
jgi:hypothetical protein